jgi:hypothetical protein
MHVLKSGQEPPSLAQRPGEFHPLSVPQKEDCRMGQQWIQKLALPNAQEGLRRSRQYVAQCVLVDFAVILILVVLLVKKTLTFIRRRPQ